MTAAPTVSWHIETADAGRLDATALLDDVPEYRRGETRSFTFGFPAAPPGPADYRAARELLDYAGAVATGTSMRGVPRYRSQVPARADVTEQLVGLVPSSELQSRFNVRGVWGIVDGGGDTTLPTVTGRAISFEVFVLAEYADYDDRAAVKAEFST